MVLEDISKLDGAQRTIKKNLDLNNWVIIQGEE